MQIVFTLTQFICRIQCAPETKVGSSSLKISPEYNSQGPFHPRTVRHFLNQSMSMASVDLESCQRAVFETDKNT